VSSQEELEKIAKAYKDGKTPAAEWFELDRATIEESYRVLRPHFVGTSAIELGCGQGHFTKFLPNNFDFVVGVDGSKQMCNDTVQNCTDDVQVVHSMFEDLDLGGDEFDSVFLLHVLEHVDDPVDFLKMASGLRTRKGKIFIVVPNAYSFHRLLGVGTDVIKDVHDLTERDEFVGHQRVYDKWLLRKHVEDAGLHMEASGGIFFKPLPGAMMAKLPPQFIEAYFHMAKGFPDNSSEIWMVCR
jgi:2-polyprenyl-3-methyl-5-hydroxy-6-metoxy-1,4-benzoquinol methylase